jgi:hypothetical protein
MTKRFALGITAMLTVLTAYAEQERQEKRNDEVILRVQAGNIPGPLLIPAMAEASSLLSQVGVRVRWKHPDDRGEAHRPVRECTGQAPDVSIIDILILDRSRVDDHPGALGYSLPFARSGVRVVVFFDRIQTSMHDPSPKLLGHVIAHEIGHMFIGTFSHAPDGIMRAHWTGRDMTAMQIHPLAFSPADAATIAQRLDRQRNSCRPIGLLASLTGE